MEHRMVAGTALFLAGIVFGTGIMLAEFIYPGYSVSENYISDLGVWDQPSAIIFNSSVFIFGLLLILSSYMLKRKDGRWRPNLPLVLTGIGAIGVAVFPETIRIPHAFFALMAFIFGNLAAVLSYKRIKPPFSYLAVILGVIGLSALVLFGSGNFLGLGAGGMERMIAYPMLFWSLGFGALLMSEEAEKINSPSSSAGENRPS